MTWRVIVGTFSLVATMILLGYVAVTETHRMQLFTNAYGARQIETGAALFETNCQRCHGDRGQGVPGLGPALNTAELFNGERLTQAGFAGALDDFVRLTIAAGRPRRSAWASEQGFVEAMPTWAEQNGGPLRTDQVESLTSFIMNWGLAYEGGAAPPTPVVEGVGTDITVALPAGDPERGAELARAQGCIACHIDSPTGPPWLATADPGGVGIAARAAQRVASAAYTGQATTPEQYLFESIVQPNAHVVEGYQPDVMPRDYGQKLSAQDVADIIAYILTIE